MVPTLWRRRTAALVPGDTRARGGALDDLRFAAGSLGFVVWTSDGDGLARQRRGERAQADGSSAVVPVCLAVRDVAQDVEGRGSGALGGRTLTR